MTGADRCRSLSNNPLRSVGLLIIPLVSLRLIYRLANPPLRLPEDIPGMQRLAAHATHGCLYALLIVQPVIGWIAISACRAPISVFGWFDLPPIWPENRPFSEQMSSIHGLIGTAIACGHSYWRRALSSFCAQGEGPHAHGHRLISKQLRGCSLRLSRPGAPSSPPPMDRPTRPISRVKRMSRSAPSPELPKGSVPSRNLMDFKIKLPPAE
jgi:hypothetical protein